ncbi:tRNA (adenosine(37)-N6)-threonylcarbamoyltransferase complex ATPase subunit type 1 TsaE [Phocicoccus pinnipedialis]
MNSLSDTLSFGIRLGKRLLPGMVILLEGDLGAGKTTLSQSIGKGLDVKRHMTSPTFNIIKTYKGKYKIHHMDCYRLEGSDEDLGFDEYFNDEDIALVEWYTFIEDYLPKEFLHVSIGYVDESTREIVLTPVGDKYIELVGELNENTVN